MPGNFEEVSRPPGFPLTASAYNADINLSRTFMTPLGADDYSDSVAQMRLQTDPGAFGSESLAVSTAGELERIRFILQQLGGGPYWGEPAGAGVRVENAVSFTVNAVDTQALLTVVDAVPVGAILKAILAFNLLAFGDANGLTGYLLDSGENSVSYGLMPITISAVNTGLWTGYAQEYTGTATKTVRLRAQGGPFDTVGRCILTVVYDTFTIPTSV